jgi:hypothetical protein
MKPSSEFSASVDEDADRKKTKKKREIRPVSMAGMH